MFESSYSVGTSATPAPLRDMLRQPPESWAFEKPFEFVVGAEKDVAYLHVGLVQKDLAPSLHALIHGGFKETHERRATFTDIDKITFARFIEYLYTGNYIVEKCEFAVNHTEEATTEETPKVVDFDKPCHGLKSFRCRWCGTGKLTAGEAANNFPFCSTKHKSLAEGINAKYPKCAKCGEIITSAVDSTYTASTRRLCVTCEKQQKAGTRSGFDCSMSVSGTMSQAFKDRALQVIATDSSITAAHKPHTATGNLMQHAKLYFLADQWMMESLSRLALFKLNYELHSFALGEQSVCHLLDVIDYAWTDDLAKDEPNAASTEELTIRSTLIAYFEEKAEELRKYEEFKAYQLENNAFTIDCLDRVLHKRRRVV